MTHIKNSKRTHDKQNIALSRFGVYIIYACAIPVINMISILMSADKQLSLSDCIVLCSNGSYSFWITIMPLTVVLWKALSVNYSRVQYIIRQKNRSALYYNQVKRILFISAVSALYNSFTALMIGSFFSSSFCNWSSPLSLYFSVNHEVNYSVSFSQAALQCTFHNFLSIFTVCTVAFLIEIICENQLIGLAYIIMTMGWNILQWKKFPIATSFLATGYYAFAHSKRFVFGYIICGLIIAAALSAGRVVFKKRDFYYA